MLFNDLYKDNMDNLIEDITADKRAQFLTDIKAELNPNSINFGYLLRS